MPVQNESANVAEQATYHDVAMQTEAAALPDPVVPLTAEPLPTAPEHEQDVSMKEVAQMVGAMVFVFGFAALGLHAVFYAGY
ncbi:hypothetical protein [Acetobacter sp.]|uniref:hypothetical protein n=1 Tax=Acetobacter sp. TaxID=440 RepID=UPI0039ED8D74